LPRFQHGICKSIGTISIKLRGRSFYKDSYDIPFVYPTRRHAMEEAEKIADLKNRNPMNRSPSTEVVRVRLRVGEIV
jgi:hypothetical protein